MTIHLATRTEDRLAEFRGAVTAIAGELEKVMFRAASEKRTPRSVVTDLETWVQALRDAVEESR